MEIFTTPTTTYYSNGTLKFQSRHEGNLIIVTEWWSNGKKLREYVRDRENLWFVGERKEYSSDGHLEIILPYSNNGIAHGIQKQFNPDGSIIIEVYYENGVVTNVVEH